MNRVACLRLRASAATPPFASRCRAAPQPPGSVSRLTPRASASTAGIYLPSFLSLPSPHEQIPPFRSPFHLLNIRQFVTEAKNQVEGEVESASQFEERLFGEQTGSNDSPFFRKLDGVGNSFRRPGMGSFGQNSDRGNFGFGGRSSSGFIDGFDSLNDGMNEKLDDAARTFQMTEEVDDEDYDFRPDVDCRRGSTYNVRDLDLTRPAAPRNPPRPQFETSTKEVLRKADFRNVRFLSNFLTEAGIVIKRSQTKISAKAQRKVAREIKTSRALGLMPFTTMGKRPFIFGRSVEEDASEEENGYEFVEQEARPEDIVNDAVPDVETA